MPATSTPTIPQSTRQNAPSRPQHGRLTARCAWPQGTRRFFGAAASMSGGVDIKAFREQMGYQGHHRHLPEQPCRLGQRHRGGMIPQIKEAAWQSFSTAASTTSSPMSTTACIAPWWKLEYPTTTSRAGQPLLEILGQLGALPPPVLQRVLQPPMILRSLAATDFKNIAEHSGVLRRNKLFPGRQRHGKEQPP